ncbi:MAG: hypothetical protein JO113_03975, partial [Candidatus Eremiobacteraeota bacterium]|nr:hypothetical protein [Candidatus Eremiobacteraeota bacterium]
MRCLAFGLSASITILTACAGSQPTVPSVFESPVIRGSISHDASWMRAGAKSIKLLLYVSDFQAGRVYVSDYATGDLQGILAGFNEPAGLCVDAGGDVWIAQADGEAVVEYAHGGTRPIKTLNTSGRAFGCSVAPNGDLAVANFDVGSSPGSVQVFKHASGTPQQYTCPGRGYYYPPGYDIEGNLYVEALDNLRLADVGVCMLASNGNSMKSVNVNVTINSGGSVMWDGRHITLTDVDYDKMWTTAVYRARESAGGDLTVIGTTQLTANHGNTAVVQQPFLIGKENPP